MPKPTSTETRHKPRKSSSRNQVADWFWMAQFEIKYQRKSRENAANRAIRRDNSRRAKLQHADTHQANANTWADIEARSGSGRKRELVNARLTKGFHWRGGPVAGNARYLRAAFHQAGLISDEHPILMLFVTKLRRAKHLRVGDTKKDAVTSDSKLLALDSAYVESNKIMCGVIRIEIDQTLPVTTIIDGCLEAGVPCPNIVVGWKNDDSEYVRPHLIWLLRDSLPIGDGTPNRFRSLYRGVLRGLTKALIPIGADPGGLFNSHRHKNPLSPLWDRQVFAEQPHNLGTLAGHVDVKVRMSNLEHMARSRCDRMTAAMIADHPTAEVAVASNQFFSKLACWARIAVVKHRADGGDEYGFAAAVACQARRLITELPAADARSDNQVLAIAARVADWTWNIYRAPKRRTKLAAEEITRRESEGARQTALKRRTKTEAIIVAATAKLYAQNGKMPTQVAVLAAVRDAGIRSEKTIRAYWPTVLVEGATGNLPCAYVKKNIADCGGDTLDLQDHCPVIESSDVVSPAVVSTAVMIRIGPSTHTPRRRIGTQ